MAHSCTSLLSSCSAEYFKETDSEGKDAVHSAIQRLQRDPDRDVRYFAGVEEDALDLTYEGHVTSLHTAQEHYQDMNYDPEEDLELYNQTSDDGENKAEDLNETCGDNLESRTETFDDSAEQLDDVDQIVGEEVSSADTLVNTNVESTTQEFEENERRVDLESKDDSDQEQIGAEVSDDLARSAEETELRENEVQGFHSHTTLPCHCVDHFIESTF